MRDDQRKREIAIIADSNNYGTYMYKCYAPLPHGHTSASVNRSPIVVRSSLRLNEGRQENDVTWYF